MRPSPLIPLLAALAFTAAQPLRAEDAAAQAPPPSEADLQTWIRDLGADDFSTREAATRKLEDAGEAAEPALKVSQSDDPEVRSRVEGLLLHLEGPPPVPAGNAPIILKSLVNHQSVLRLQDADKNGLADYWTRDVAAFHCLRDANDKVIAFISLGIARADAAPAAQYPELGSPPKVRKGYLFKAMRIDQDGNSYLQKGLPAPTAKGAPGGVCGNQSRFGFCTWPARYGVDGKLTFIVNEDGTVWQKDLGPKAQGVDSRQQANPEEAGSGWSHYGG